MAPHPKSSCLYESLERRVTIDIFGTNRSTTHPCALAKISTVDPLRNYLLSRVEQTKFKGLANLNNVRLVIVNGANITLFNLCKKLKLVCKSIEFQKLMLQLSYLPLYLAWKLFPIVCCNRWQRWTGIET